MSVYPRTREELEKFIKKPYQPAAVDEWLDLILYAKKLEDENKSLKEILKQTELELKSAVHTIDTSPELKLGNAVAEYIKETTSGESDIRKIVRQEVKNHLSIDVDAEWDPYSGQHEHHHKVDINWN